MDLSDPAWPAPVVGSDPYALVVVDVQEGFTDTAYWGSPNNPEFERSLALLLAAWTGRRWPVVVIRHDSADPGSPLHPSSPGNRIRRPVDGVTPALTVAKSVNSSFHGDPDLAGWLRGQGLRGIAVCGITTNHCCETTARIGSNLGFDTLFVIDATQTFDRTMPTGEPVGADELARTTAANLHGEFGQVTTAARLVESLDRVRSTEAPAG